MLLQQPFGVLTINFQTVRLTIRPIRSTHIRTFVPVDAKPFEVVNELVLKAGLAAIHVGVLDTQHHRAALLAREQPVKKCSAGISDVKMTSRRRLKPYANVGV